MSSRGWKLSAALTLAPTLALAQANDSDMIAKAKAARQAQAAAVNCTLLASTVYAQLTAETARAASILAHRKCKDQWEAVRNAITAASVAELVSKTGTVVTNDTINAAKASTDLYPKMSLDEIEQRVADLRALAKVKGDSAFAEQRKLYESYAKAQPQE